MTDIPIFPHFKPIELADRPIFVEAIRAYRPETSELTFTNLFIWRAHYHFQWSLHKDWLLVIGEENGGELYAIEPIGPTPRHNVTLMLLDWIKMEGRSSAPGIERVDGRLVAELEGVEGLVIEPTRDHFDYVYLRSDLIELAGNKYRSKRNHINKLLRLYSFTYEPLTQEHVGDCLELQDKWCSQRRCDDDLSLMGEWEAVREILANYESLELKGGVILVDGKVEAFTVGEMLNDETVVIHIEKADAEIPGLYAIINQQCCENCWGDATYVNREQDLGVPGLREAKLSYYPHHLVEKFKITRSP